MIRVVISALVAIMVCADQLIAAESESKALGLPGLLEEVASEAKSPHIYDWRNAVLELRLGYGKVIEYNDFDNSAWEFGIGIPFDGWILDFGLRRVKVEQTSSSRLLGRTPFEQDAQVSRYELFVDGSLRLTEGRAMTALSPLIPDVEQATFVVAGIHISHPNRRWIPSKSDRPEPYAGQRRVNSERNFELGFKWQLYLPQALGVYFMAQRQWPLGSTGALGHYDYLTGGALWSFSGS